MVAKTAARSRRRACTTKGTSSKYGQNFLQGARQKLRVGVIVGKTFDPIPQGTQDRHYPKRFKVMNNTGPRASGWGGMFQVDVSVALKMARSHPELLAVDLIPGKEVSAARLKRNHANINLFYDVVMAEYNEGRSRARSVKDLFRNADCRMWPSFDYYDWVCTKPRYMRQCQKAGIPIIDTIFVESGLDPNKLLRQIQAKGWDKCFIKSAAYVCFGNAAIHGKVRDWVDDPSLLLDFAKENIGVSSFLVQPYILKPNGKVFDEVRNFFVDGRWSYSVYTDGTDDDAVYEQPAGAIKDACRALSERAYGEVLKVAKWEGKSMAPLFSRIDIGVVPDRSAAKGFRVFLNEIECEISTWLPRYCPFNLCEVVARASVKKSVELVEGLLDAGRSLPASRALRATLAELKRELGDACT